MLIVAFVEALRPPPFGDGNCIFIIICNACIEQVGANKWCGPSLPGVTVDEDFPSLSDAIVHDLHYVEHLLEGGVSHVLPEAIEELDAVVHHQFGCIAEPRLQTDPISAEGMLSWLLEVKDGCYTRSK